MASVWLATIAISLLVRARKLMTHSQQGVRFRQLLIVIVTIPVVQIVLGCNPFLVFIYTYNKSYFCKTWLHMPLLTTR